MRMSGWVRPWARIAGINALNLRSLGTVRTLVLMDGRRIRLDQVANVSDTTLFQALLDDVPAVRGSSGRRRCRHW
mgnify:CR=1 FL=1